MESNNIELRQVRDLGQIITASFKFFKTNFRPLMTAYFYLVGIPFFVVLAIAALYIGRSILDPNAVLFSDAEGISAVAVLVLTILVFAFLFPAVAYAYVAHYARDGFGNFDFRDIRRTIRVKFWRILGASLISTLFMLIGFALCILPGIYVAIPLSMTLIALFYEDLSTTDAVERGFQLVQDNWWTSFAILLVVWLITLMIQTVFQIPKYALVLGALLLGDGSDFAGEIDGTVAGVLFAGVSLLEFAGMFFTSIFLYLGISLQYFNLIEQHSRSGLMNRIDEIGQNDDTTNDLTPPELL